MATWSTPSGIPGATPGSCTPASGSTFPLFTSTVTCQVLDHAKEVATGTFPVNVAPTTQYFTRVLIPSNGAVLAGSPYLDAAAGDGPGVIKVVFEVSGGTLSDKVIATATPTLFGWLAKWNTTGGAQRLLQPRERCHRRRCQHRHQHSHHHHGEQSRAHESVLIPSNEATLSGSAAILDASASNATSVEFALFGGTYGLSGHLIGTATATI